MKRSTVLRKYQEVVGSRKTNDEKSTDGLASIDGAFARGEARGGCVGFWLWVIKAGSKNNRTRGRKKA